MNWYLYKVKYNKLDQSEKESMVTEAYLIDAMTWIEAETRAHEKIREIVSTDYRITKVQPSKIVEVFPYDTGEFWFDIAVNMIVVNEEIGKEVITKVKFLIMADDIDQSIVRIRESLSDSMSTYVIASAGVSEILDVY